MDWTEAAKVMAEYIGIGIGTALLAAVFKLLKAYMTRIENERLYEAVMAVVIEVEKQAQGLWDGPTKKQKALEKLTQMGWGASVVVLDKLIDIAVAELDDYLTKLTWKARKARESLDHTTPEGV